jgi:glucose/arabinose dehydrogenase
LQVSYHALLKHAAIGAGILLSAVIPARCAENSDLQARITLPPGFSISVFGEMPGPREIAVDEQTGLIFVGSRSGHIYSMLDRDNDGKADFILKRADGLNAPNGVAVKNSTLFVGMTDRIAKWPIPADPESNTPIAQMTTVTDQMRNLRHHGLRYIRFGPDGRLYVSLGAPCNICDLDALTGKIVSMNPDGSDREIVADGVRNSVGFDWHPKTGEFWFTDNGADRMGDDIPPDELNRVTAPGQKFGFPYFGGKEVRLTGYQGRTPPGEVQPAEIEFQAHSANLGIDFYDGKMFPPEYRGDAFVAQHGSWNRSEKVGYQIVRVRFDDAGNALSVEPFATGWLKNGAVTGRPVDIKELPDGSLLVSDDGANTIYRIAYGE